jgi:integrase
VPGRRAIKIATPEQYSKVRACLPTKPAQVFSTLLVSSGMRFCEAIGLEPDDFDFEAGILEVARSVVKVSREHHPQGKTFLVRDYTKNGQTRRLKLDRAVAELVRGYVAEHGIGATEVMFAAELVVPPRRTKPRLTEEEIRALGDCEPVGGLVYAHGTMGGYVQAKCRWRFHQGRVPAPAAQSSIREWRCGRSTRQGHGSLGVTFPYAAILDKRHIILEICPHTARGGA